MFNSLVRLRDSRPFPFRHPRMKAPPGGPVCQNSGSAQCHPVCSVRLFFIVLLFHSTGFHTYGIGMLCLRDRSESETDCLRSEIGKCWHLKMDEKSLTCR